MRLESFISCFLINFFIIQKVTSTIIDCDWNGTKINLTWKNINKDLCKLDYLFTCTLTSSVLYSYRIIIQPSEEITVENPIDFTSSPILPNNFIFIFSNLKGININNSLSIPV